MNTAMIVDQICARRGRTANTEQEEEYVLGILNQVYRDVLAHHDWPWLRDRVILRMASLISVTGDVTSGSAIITGINPPLTAESTAYEEGMVGDENGEIHEIVDVDPAANTIQVREPWIGPTTGDTPLDLWKDRYSVGGSAADARTGTATFTASSETVSDVTPILCVSPVPVVIHPPSYVVSS